jgi:hypothetical protein
LWAQHSAVAASAVGKTCAVIPTDSGVAARGAQPASACR